MCTSEARSCLTVGEALRSDLHCLHWAEACDIDENEIAMAVLNGLPARFNSLISALDALGNEDEAFSGA